MYSLLNMEHGWSTSAEYLANVITLLKPNQIMEYYNHKR